MAKKFLQPIDLTQLELLNVRMQQLASAPGSPVSGQFWYNTTNARPQWRDGTTNNDIYPFATTNVNNTGVLRDGSGNFAAGTITASLTGTASNATQLNNQNDTFYLARANHTGTQLASTISNFDTQVRTSRLDQMAAPTATVSFNSQLISNVLDPVSPQDVATKAYVDATAQGLDIKSSVRVATAAALPAYSRTGSVITASANGALAAVDGVTLVLNDRLLVKNGASNVDNGIYTVTQVGTGGTPFILTRSTDADASIEVTAGMFTFVEEGSTLADTGWVLTTNNAITLNTTALTFTQFSGAGTYIAGTGITISGNTISINTGYVGQTSITTLGTIATGTWQATAVAPQYGGTGVNGASAANGTLLIGNGAGYTLATLTQGTNISITNGAGTITIATASTVLTGTLVSGRVPFANGTQSLTDNAKMVFDASTGFNVNMASSGTNNLTLGTSAGDSLAAGSNNVILGVNALTVSGSAGNCVAVGFTALGNTTGTSSSTAVGYNSLQGATGSNNTALGAAAGEQVGAGANNIFLGMQAGDVTASGASNRLVAGSNTSPITQVYIGNGETNATSAGSITYNATGGNGTNKAGGSFTIAGGISTGTGVGGAIVFQTTPVGASSATPNTLTTRLTIAGDGAAAWTGIATGSAPAVAASNQGRIYYDSTAQAFMVSTNTGAYATMSVGGIGGTLVAGRITLSNGASSVTDSATLTYTATGGLTMAPTAVATGTQVMATFTGAANTNMTLSTEVSDVVFALARTVQWATGGITTQRAVRIAAPTYAFVGASTITNAATFAISGAPVAGTNATLTNTYALWVQGGISRFDGNLSINDAVNIVLGTTTGTQIGTGSTQKIGFYGTTPVVQQTGNISTALASLGLVTSGTLPFASLTATPTTLSGYGITNGALNGDVTASGLTMSTARLLGRTTAATGAIEEITIGSGLSMSGGVLSTTGAGTVQKYAVSIGNGALTTFTITHNLGSLDVTYEIYDNGTGESVIADVIHATTNTLTVNVAVAPTTNQYRVVVTG